MPKKFAVKFRRSTDLRNKLFSAQMEVFGTTLMLISSVESRWFSNYYLLERMLTISSDIEGVIKGESLKLDEKYREQFIKEFTL